LCAEAFPIKANGFSGSGSQCFLIANLGIAVINPPRPHHQDAREELSLEGFEQTLQEDAKTNKAN